MKGRQFLLERYLLTTGRKVLTSVYTKTKTAEDSFYTLNHCSKNSVFLKGITIILK